MTTLMQKPTPAATSSQPKTRTNQGLALDVLYVPDIAHR
jgi:hypothetical protein